MKITIGYAYPSSERAAYCANSFGCRDFLTQGCFYVVKLDANSIELSLEAFSTWQDAKSFADATELPFDRYSLSDPTPKT